MGGNPRSRECRCRNASWRIQRGVSQRIWHTMQPARPSLSDDTRILDGIGNPSRAKFDGCKAHRRVVAPGDERGLVSIMGPGGLFYANAFSTFGAVSAGHIGIVFRARFTAWRLSWSKIQNPLTTICGRDIGSGGRRDLRWVFRNIDFPHSDTRVPLNRGNFLVKTI